MTNVIPFPDLRISQAVDSEIFNEAQVRAFVERFQRDAPEAVVELTNKMRVATKTAQLLQLLITEIQIRLDAGALR